MKQTIEIKLISKVRKRGISLKDWTIQPKKLNAYKNSMKK